MQLNKRDTTSHLIIIVENYPTVKYLCVTSRIYYSLQGETRVRCFSQWDENQV